MLKVRSVKNGTTPSSEHVVIDVMSDCWLDDFMIMDSTFNHKGEESNKSRHVYVPEVRSVKKGDVIFLHTAKGTDSSSGAEGSKTIHLYWGLGVCVWNQTGDMVYLIDLGGMSKSNVQKFPVK
ncbi:MAG: hypothetical protein VXY56_10135 [Pseudomonadota bacterium]|nr:hypothetical protein [Pseudomonadota bacterium]